MNPLPPQAYTKETLLRAFSWLQNQNNSIKEMASTPDIMVSLYLKATRDGDSALDRPSIQNFKNELKSLAGMMGELDLKGPELPPLSPPASVKPSFQEPPQVQISSPPPTPVISTQAQQLDELSLQMLEEIKNGFNLSCQTEALRLVIKLGYLKAQKILTE